MIFLAVRRYRSWISRLVWSAMGIVAVTFALYALLTIWLLVGEWHAGVSL
jgi:hypothetical protein